MSTYFERKEIHKSTWKAPDNRTCDQIDHVLIEDIHRKAVQNVRTYRRANADSDYFMVGSLLQQAVPDKRRVQGNEIDMKASTNSRLVQTGNKTSISRC